MSGKLNQYPIELVKRESVETFGKCFIPRKIMKQENIHSGNIIVIKAMIDEIVFSSLFALFSSAIHLLLLHGKRKI